MPLFRVEALEKFVVRTVYEHVLARDAAQAEQICRNGHAGYDIAEIEEGDEVWLETVEISQAPVVRLAEFDVQDVPDRIMPPGTWLAVDDDSETVCLYCDQPLFDGHQWQTADEDFSYLETAHRWRYVPGDIVDFSKACWFKPKRG